MRGTNKRNQVGPAEPWPWAAGRIAGPADLSDRDDHGRLIVAALLPG